ncbi:MAG: indolepyruvate ferredoxin oxidoreductase subunit beta [Nitrososphaerales archaeon]
MVSLWTPVERFDVVIAGVGGQGTILASRIIGRAAVIAGLKVRGSELLGMSQRGGAVYSHVRFGTKVEAPIIPEGAAHILLSFEPAEGLRYLHYLSKNSLILVNTKPIIPQTVSSGLSKYPELEHILQHYRSYATTITLDATALAIQAGNPIATNSAMIGAMVGSGRFPLPAEVMLQAIEESVRKSLFDVNKKAFYLGFEKAKQLLESESKEAVAV